MRFSTEEYNSLYSKVPRLTVDVLIRDNEGKFLLTKRSIFPKGLWHIPGGTMFIDESAEQAISRVVKEELNVKVKMIKLIGFTDWFNKGFFGHPVSMVFEALLLSPKEDIKLDFQASEWAFFDIVPDDTIEEQKEIINKFFNNS